MDAQRLPIAVHECEDCGAKQTPEETGQTVNVSGLVTCKICGHVGPINLRIIEPEQKRRSARESKA